VRARYRCASQGRSCPARACLHSVGLRGDHDSGALDAFAAARRDVPWPSDDQWVSLVRRALRSQDSQAEPNDGPEVDDMQYLVTMTTRVPRGASEEDVDDVRGREAIRSRELAACGHLIRLWRPPLKPGEWRSLGLFAAEDEYRLEEVLASMPLRIWRDDDVTPLSPHPNDPPTPPSRRGAAREFLTTFTLPIPDTVDVPTVDEAQAAESRSARELAAEGYLVRLWGLPGHGRALGLWQADSAGELQAILGALPLGPWLDIETIPLTGHPNDPAVADLSAGRSSPAL